MGSAHLCVMRANAGLELVITVVESPAVLRSPTLTSSGTNIIPVSATEDHCLYVIINPVSGLLTGLELGYYQDIQLISGSSQDLGTLQTQSQVTYTRHHSFPRFTQGSW